MSIDAINAGLTPPLFTPGLRPGGAAETHGTVRPERPATAERAAPAAAGSEAVPSKAPEGTDPALWSVLTSEERAFFARARALGPVTYGPGRRAALSGAPLGGRLDLRV